MSDFATRITTLVDASAPPIDIEGLARQLESDTELSGALPVVPQRRPANWLVAVGAAIVVFVLIGGSLWLIGGNDSEAVEEPTTTVTVETPTTVPDVTTTTATPPIPSEPLVLPVVPSQAPPADQSPLEWRWDPTAGGFDATGEWRWDSNAGGAFDATALQDPVTGWYCYGSGGDRSTVVEFGGGSIKFQLGHTRTPEIVVTDTEGTSTNVGNPFDEQAWLCSVAATDTHLLAVGSSVWWSADGIAWNDIEEFEVFEEVDDRNVDGSNLLWAAAGPGGYVVLGRADFSEQAPIGERVGWYSQDLDTWYEVPFEDGPPYEGWGWFGPDGIAVGDESVIVALDGAWIATRP